MNEILNKKFTITFEYNGIKIIQCNNPNLFVKEIMESTIILNEVKSNNKIIISDLTKIKELITLTKNSYLINRIINIISNNNIIDDNNIEKIIDTINNEANFELLSSSDGDIKKIIETSINLNNDLYINKDILKYYLENFIDDSKKLIIFNDISFVNIKFLLKYINNFNFLIITSDFRKYLSSNDDELETLLLVNDSNWEHLDIIDKNKLLNFFELETNINIKNNDVYSKIINEHYCYESVKFLWVTKQIISYTK